MSRLKGFSGDSSRRHGSEWWHSRFAFACLREAEAATLQPCEGASGRLGQVLKAPTHSRRECNVAVGSGQPPSRSRWELSGPAFPPSYKA